MQIGTKFSVSIHILLSVEVFKERNKITSDFIARSVNTNPVVIRKLMSLLRKAGIIVTAKGTGGIELTRLPEEITLLDIYRAIEPQTDLFKIHSDTPPGCPLGGRIEDLLNPFFFAIQSSFSKDLDSTTLDDLLKRLGEMRKEGEGGTIQP